MYFLRGMALCVFLTGCASAPQQAAAPIRPINCKAGPDCDAKWSRAVSWIATNSGYKIRSQTADLIQTMGPTDSSPTAAFTVTKVATAPGSFDITFAGGCDNVFGCIPTVAESRAAFADFIMAELPAAAGPMPPVPAPKPPSKRTAAGPAT